MILRNQYVDEQLRIISEQATMGKIPRPDRLSSTASARPLPAERTL